MIENMHPLIGLCPINFKKFNEINDKIGSLEATLLYSKIKFHLKHTKITKFGGKCIIRTREEIASWFDISTKKIDSLLQKLIKLGYIKKKVSTWYGKRSLFLQDLKESELDIAPINMAKLDVLKEKTGSIQSALIYSLIIYRNAASFINHENKIWCSLKKQTIADWAKISIRTVDKYINHLLKIGLLLKKKFNFAGKFQSHFHIPEFMTKIFSKNEISLKEAKTNPQNCRPEPAKKGISIKVRTNNKKTNNNSQHLFTTCNASQDIINFDKIDKELTKKQKKYIEKSFKNNIRSLQITCPDEILEQIIYSVSNDQQHKNIASFKHRVFRCMKMLRNNTWRVPVGFYKYSDSGKKLKSKMENRAKQWNKVKKDSYQAVKESRDSKEMLNLKSLTTKACQYAKTLKSMIMDNGQNKIGISEYLESQILNLLKKGADKSSVQKILDKNI